MKLAVATPTGGTLAGTTAVSAKAGVATFSSILIDKAGTYTLKATDGTLTSATSTSIKVNPGAASKLVITKAPTTGKVGVALSGLAVAIEDAFGNIVTTNTTKVTVTIPTAPAARRSPARPPRTRSPASSLSAASSSAKQAAISCKSLIVRSRRP